MTTITITTVPKQKPVYSISAAKAGIYKDSHGDIVIVSLKNLTTHCPDIDGSVTVYGLTSEGHPVVNPGYHVYPILSIDITVESTS